MPVLSVVRLLPPLCVVLLVAVPARAQQPPRDPDDATVKIGPLSIKPTLIVKNIGRDNNVFNESSSPKSDFTMTISPTVELVFHPRRLKLTYAQTTDYVYFKKYKSERGTNQSSNLKAEFTLGPLTPYIGATTANSRDRYNTEVDIRARHKDTGYNAGVNLKLFTRTTASLGVRTVTYRFNEGVATRFRGQSLARSFNATLDSVDAGIGLALTPLTSFMLGVTKERERFQQAPERDSDTIRVMPTLTFSPLGLINGSVALGYRKFTPRDPRTPAFKGFVAAVTSGVTLFDRHRIDVTVTRDLSYSYDAATPTYIQTGGSVAWTFVVAGPFDVKATAARNLMNYQGTAAAPVNTSDTYSSYAVGLGYRVRRKLRIGANGDWAKRASQHAGDRAYDNHKIYGTLTWGS